ncbi:MAG: hypothetical protein HYY22_01250 [Thaumarchaeota archaeon]|nr:hypothetical protein [Nitrososphaerota archaeon]
MSENNCIIQSVKPKICCMYPLGIRKKRETTEVSIDLDCPRCEGIAKELTEGRIPEAIPIPPNTSIIVTKCSATEESTREWR